MDLPVTLIGGYLGAGKTTLVNHLLRHANGRKLAVLVNEFGALPIDADLIEAQGDDLISIAGGCICCSFGSDLTAALMDLTALDPRPSHVIIECSGVALPGAIAASLSLVDGVHHDSTVVLLDAETGYAQSQDPYIGDTIQRQIAQADVILLTKSDLAAQAQLTQVQQWLTEAAPNARTVPVEMGQISPDVLLGPQDAPPQDIGRMSPSFQPNPDPDRPIAADALFTSIVLPCPRAFDGASLAQILTHPALGVTRAKGFFDPPDHGARQALHIVGHRWEITPAPPNAELGIVCIGLKGQFDSDALLSRTSEAQ